MQYYDALLGLYHFRAVCDWSLDVSSEADFVYWCMCSSDGARLPCCDGDDAVQCHGQQLLAAGGGSVSAQPAGHHRLLREELLLHLPLHRLG